MPDAIIELTKGKTLSEIISAKPAKITNTKALEKKIIEIVSKNLPLVKAKGMGAIGPLMGDLKKDPELKCMDGKVLSEMLKKEINANK